MKLYRNWIINEVARAMTKGEHMNERTHVRTYIRTGQTLYPLHNFVVRGDNNDINDALKDRHIYRDTSILSISFTKASIRDNKGHFTRL